MPVYSANLSIESNLFDTSAATVNWGFGVNAVDSATNRVTNLRSGFSYFSGFSASLTPNQLGFGNRRRLIVLQGVDGGRDQSGNELTQWRVLYIENHTSGNFSSGDDAVFRAAINSVFPAPTAQDYSAWKNANSLPAGQDGPFQDADGDGDENIKEFYFFTSPNDANSSSRPSFIPAAATGFSYTFRRAKGIAGVQMKLTTSMNLTNWDEVVLTETNTTVTDMGDYESVTVSLPSTGQLKFYRIELSELAP